MFMYMLLLGNFLYIIQVFLYLKDHTHMQKNVN